MRNEPRTLRETPSQTAGPYVHIGLTPSLAGVTNHNVPDPGSAAMGPATVADAQILISGRIVDGAGNAVADAIVEAWQADAQGGYNAEGFTGWARTAADTDGRYAFHTIKPGRVLAATVGLQAPHVTLWIIARGINIGLHTRLYFDDEPDANYEDFFLNVIAPERRHTLIAARNEESGRTTYTLDLHLQGDRETVFFDV